VRQLSVWETYGQQIVEMRQSGHTLQEIGDTVGATRERIRQILNEQDIDFNTSLLSEAEVIRLMGCNREIFRRRREAGEITPSRTVKRYRYYDSHELEGIRAVIQRYCKNCGQPLPMIYQGKYCHDCRGARVDNSSRTKI